MEINSRIKAIARDKNLTPSVFALEVGVNRSTVSHIFHNRNQPKLEFILKILKRYPDISTDWLVKGEGNMIISSTKSGNEPNHTQPFLEIPDPRDNVTFDTSQKKNKISGLKKIKRIVVFFSDGTFEEYLQPGEG